MTNNKRPPWFKTGIDHYSFLKTLDMRSVGEGYIMALANLVTGDEQRSIDPIATAVYNFLKVSVDDAVAKYEIAIESGKKKGKNK